MFKKILLSSLIGAAAHADPMPEPGLATPAYTPPVITSPAPVYTPPVMYSPPPMYAPPPQIMTNQPVATVYYVTRPSAYPKPLVTYYYPAQSSNRPVLKITQVFNQK